MRLDCFRSKRGPRPTFRCIWWSIRRWCECTNDGTRPARRDTGAVTVDRVLPDLANPWLSNGGTRTASITLSSTDTVVVSARLYRSRTFDGFTGRIPVSGAERSRSLAAGKTTGTRNAPIATATSPQAMRKKSENKIGTKLRTLNLPSP